jgi:adenylate cyclase
MPLDRRDDTLPELRHRTFDDALGRRIVDTHIWAVREGLRGADAYHLFDGYCQRLVIDGIPLWRAHAAMETLHPQWNGYGYTWRRDLNAIAPENYPHGDENEQIFVTSPFYALMQRARAGEDTPEMRRRIEASTAREATARRGQESPIRSRQIVRADSATTIRRSCRRPCPRCRWR